STGQSTTLLLSVAPCSDRGILRGAFAPLAFPFGLAKPLQQLGARIARHHRAAFGVVGIAAVSYLIWTVGTDAVLASFRVLSWRVFFVVLLPAALLKLTDARGWSALVSP